MAASLKKLLAQLRTVFGSMSPRTRVLLVVAVLAAAGILAWIALVDRTEYATLFAGLSTEDGGRITGELRKSKVPFRLEAGGTTVMVPADKVHETRLSLAGQGLPRGGGVGFEIFDTQKFGLGDFAQQVNYRRALQGELERTIAQLDAVQAARVHIALPERPLFARRAQAPSASVTLRLHPGRSLARASVQSIVHLVSSSEAGLSPDRITVVDTSGTMHWSGRDGASGSGGPLDHKRNQEELLERRVGEILDAAVGPGHSVVKVTADVALAQVEETDTEYDPEKVAVRSESTMEEKDARGATAPAGIPGVQANLPGGPAPAGGTAAGATQRKSATRNFEVAKTVRKRLSPAGELKRLSVAVLVDAAALAPAAPAAAKAARPAAAAKLDLRALEQVVKQAVGFSAARGDVVTLEKVPFAPEQKVEGPTVPWYRAIVTQQNLSLLATVVAVGVGLVIVIWIIGRVRRQARAVELLELPKTVRQLELEAEAAPAAALPAGSAPRAALGEGDLEARTLARAAAEHDAARTASVLKAWLAGE